MEWALSVWYLWGAPNCFSKVWKQALVPSSVKGSFCDDQILEPTAFVCTVYQNKGTSIRLGNEASSLPLLHPSLQTAKHQAQGEDVSHGLSHGYSHLEYAMLMAVTEHRTEWDLDTHHLVPPECNPWLLRVNKDIVRNAIREKNGYREDKGSSSISIHSEYVYCGNQMCNFNSLGPNHYENSSNLKSLAKPPHKHFSAGPLPMH